MSKYIVYQQKAEPIDVISNAASATTIDQWEPHAEVPRFRTKGERYNVAIHQDSGYATTAWFFAAAAARDTSWLVQNPFPQRIHTRKKFHPSLYPSEPFWIPFEFIEPLSIASTATVGIPEFLHSSRDAELFIGGTSFGWMESTFRIDRNLGSPDSASFDIIYFGGTRPEPGDEVVFVWGGTRRFGGLVQSVDESEIKGVFWASVLSVKCTGYRAYTDRAVVAKFYTVFLGGLAWITIYDIWLEHLQDFGITFTFEGDPGVFLGEQLFHYVTVTEAFNKIVDQTPGWSWWIDEYKQLHFKQTDGVAANAPFSLVNSDKNVDRMTVSTSSTRFRNRQWVLPSSDVAGLRTDSRTGNGVQQAFVTDYNQTVRPIIRVAGISQLVCSLGETATTPGYQWYYIPNGIGVFQNPANAAVGVGVAIDIIYPALFPLAFSAEDTASIATKGLYETVQHAKDVQTQEVAEAVAAGLLALYGDSDNFPESVTFEYNSKNQTGWLAPGQTLSSNRTFPTAIGSYIIEHVSSEEQDLAIWRHNVTMRKGPGEVTDAAALEQFRVSARVPIDSPPARATFELGMDIPGITNPGLLVGAVANRYVVQKAGVISAWDALFEIDPPTGDSIIIDVFLNGTSIFPADPTKLIIVPDAEATLVSGFEFVSENLAVARGDIITVEVMQVGSTTPGKNGVIHIDMKVRNVS